MTGKAKSELFAATLDHIKRFGVPPAVGAAWLTRRPDERFAFGERCGCCDKETGPNRCSGGVRGRIGPLVRSDGREARRESLVVL